VGKRKDRKMVWNKAKVPKEENIRLKSTWRVDRK
jgi:hypothetical protein